MIGQWFLAATLLFTPVAKHPTPPPPEDSQDDLNGDTGRDESGVFQVDQSQVFFCMTKDACKFDKPKT